MTGRLNSIRNYQLQIVMRKIKFQNDCYYHVYNRGVDKREIFIGEKDYTRFIRSMREFNQINPVGSLYSLKYLEQGQSKDTKCPIGHLVSGDAQRLVDVICYSLLPNHFHFILIQVIDEGIEKFMHKLGMGYSKYFNYKNNRSGSLFQGTYKSIHIKSDSYLNYLSAYIHGNPEIHKIEKAKDWPWSSYQDYLNKRNGTLINKNIVLQEFITALAGSRDNITKSKGEKNTEDYKSYTELVIKESGQRKDEIKNYFLE